MRRNINALCALMALTVVCAPVTIAQTESHAVTVATTHGKITGLELPGSITAYKGIRYAQPPTGEMRWKPPVPAADWTDVRKANDYAPACMQLRATVQSIYTDDPAQMSEDCLFLNVWMPKHAVKAPVMVWIHGGALRGGHLTGGLYDGSQLARKNVVVVTVNYRLGVLGYFAHPELTAESAHGSSGNYGLLDQIEALHWVRDNIARFGGDPTNVTLFGESAGALSAIELMTSPLARGLFQKVIVQSGYMVSNMELKRPSFGQPSAEDVGQYIAEKMGAANLAALRAMDATALTKDSYAAGFDPQATIDGWVLPRQIVEAFDRGEQAPVPVIAGFNGGEARSLRFFVPPLPKTAAEYEAKVRDTFGDLAPRFRKLYPSTDMEESALAAARDGFYGWTAQRLARKQTQLGVPAYLYLFEHQYPAEVPLHLEAFHASELPYEFGLIGSGTLPKNWPRMPDDARERGLSEAIMDYFTSFAHSGKPVADGGPAWKSFAEGEAYMDFAETPHASSGIFPGTYELQEEIISRRRAAGTQNWYVNIGLLSPVVPPPASPATSKDSGH